jgi:hypothetical protein
MSESPTKKRKEAPLQGGIGADPYARYGQHYGQPAPYGGHHQPPPYGYHQHPPPPHYAQGMYPNAPPPPPSHQQGQSSSLYTPSAQPWASQSQPYCQPTSQSSSPPGNWNGQSSSTEANGNGPNGRGGNRRYSPNGTSAQTQSATTDKNGDSKPSPPPASGGWHPSPWHGGPGQYMQGAPPPHMWGASSGSPPSWGRPGTSAGPPRGSPTNSIRRGISHQNSIRKEKDDGKDKGRGSYRCGKVRCRIGWIDFSQFKNRI